MLYNSTMDYYQILGVNEKASQDDIKKAYKKLAMKNHPDRGGDTKTFQSISQAYDTLSDTQKRQQYDAQKNGFNPFGQQGGQGWQDVGEMFGFSFGPGFAGFTAQQSRRNRDLTIRVSITLKQSYNGTQVEARYNTPTGRQQTVVVDIPAGVQHGQTIRYSGLGDDANPNWSRGNLNVQVIVESDPEFERINNDLYTTLEISLFEAMTGCEKNVKSLDGNSLTIKLRAGLNHGTEYCASGKGFKDINTGRQGNFMIKIVVDMPKVDDPALVKELETVYNKIIKAQGN